MKKLIKPPEGLTPAFVSPRYKARLKDIQAALQRKFKHMETHGEFLEINPKWITEYNTLVKILNGGK